MRRRRRAAERDQERLSLPGSYVSGGASFAPFEYFADNSPALVGEGAGLMLDFMRKGGAVGVKDPDTFANNQLNTPFLDWLTNSGTSPKLVLNESGVYEWTAHNLFTYSEQFDAVDYVVSNLSVTANDTTAPDGNGTADKITGDGTSGQHLISQNATWFNGATYTFSCRFKNDDQRYIQIAPQSSSGFGTAYANFDLQEGTVGTVDSAATATITSLGDGWYLCTCTATAVGSATGKIYIALIDGPTAGKTPTITTSGSVFCWGYQNNRGTVPTTYMSTITAARFAVPQEYDPVTERWYVLVEPQATNLVTDGVTLTTGWIKENSSDTRTGSQADPFGGNDAVLHVAGATTGTNHWQYFSTGLSVTAQGYSVDYFVKAGGSNKAFISFATAGLANGGRAKFTLSGAGSVDSVINAGTGTNTSAKIKRLGETDWYRVSLTTTFAGAATAYPAVAVLNASGDLDYAGSGESLYYCYYKCETGTVATSPIPTFGSTVTRAASAINKALSAVPFSATANTLYLAGKTPKAAAAAVLVSLDDGTANERFRIEYTGTNLQCVITDGGSAVATLDLGAVAVDTAFQITFSWEADSVAASLNGGAVVTDTDTGGGLPTVDTLRIGYSPSGEQGAWEITKLVHVPRRVSDADLPTWRYAA